MPPKRKNTAAGKKKKQTIGYPDLEEDEIYSEVDKFAQAREKVSLNPEEDSAGSEDEDELDGDELTLGLEESDEDEDAEEGEEEDEEERAHREAALEAEKKISTAWRGKEFYGAETEDFDALDADFEKAEAEEKEALRLQREQAEELAEEDFDAQTAMLETIVKVKAAKAKAKAAAAAASKAKAAPKRKARYGDSWDDDGAEAQEQDQEQAEQEGPQPVPVAEQEEKKQGGLLGDVSAQLEGISLGLDTGELEVERVERDVSALSEEEKLALLEKESPELLGLLDDFKKSVDELRKQVQPLLERVRQAKLPTSEGISLLEIKNMMLLSYCTNLSFYLLLKAEGRSVKSHPVIKNLVMLRTMLEKLRPLEKKLSYQINKLLKAAELGPETAAAADPLSYKPKPSALVSAEQEGEGGRYVPPKIRPMAPELDEKAAAREKRQKEREVKRALSSRLTKELLAMDEEAPEEEVYGEAAHRDRAEEEKLKFELDNFMRLAVTREERKRLKERRRIKPMAGLEDEFADYDPLIEAESKRHAADGFDDLEQLRAQKAGEKEKGKKRKAPEPASEEELDMEEGSAFYEEAERLAKKRKQERAEAHPIPYKYMAEEDPDLLEEGERRGATQTILKNEGLKKYRPKHKKTPRTAKREKFRQAQKKVRSQVQQYKGSVTQGYQGEKTGIKPSLVRSISLKGS